VDGKLFTWGSGENEMLGHGNRNNQSSPKIVDALSHLFVLSISCGAFHTGVIANSSKTEGGDGEHSFIELPSSKK
jgi:alpha-tubulin suppressor-like RCC1 family protein